LYDISNYYHIEGLEESITYLILSGYSQEEILDILSNIDDEQEEILHGILHIGNIVTHDDDKKQNDDEQYRRVDPNKK
jgi:hypothetical protein